MRGVEHETGKKMIWRRRAAGITLLAGGLGVLPYTVLLWWAFRLAGIASRSAEYVEPAGMSAQVTGYLVLFFAVSALAVLAGIMAFLGRGKICAALGIVVSAVAAVIMFPFSAGYLAPAGCFVAALVLLQKQDPAARQQARDNSE